MDLKAKSKVGVVGYSSHVNGKLVFRVNGSYEHNDIIQGYWDREKAYIHEDCPVLGYKDLVVDTIPANNEYGYKLRLLAIWDNIKKIYIYDFDGIANVALYLDLEICWSYNR